jgi:hypothetical protein
MSKKNTQELAVMGEIETDAKINMTDIVAIYTSKYEERLYASKATLTAEITEGRKVIASMTKGIVEAVVADKFIVKNPLFAVKVSGKELSEGQGVVRVSFECSAIDADGVANTSGRGYSSTTTRDIKVPKKAMNDLAKAKDKLNVFVDELNTVMVSIRDMGRKERQIKARITEKKLETTGMKHLLEDEGLRKLIEL